MRVLAQRFGFLKAFFGGKLVDAFNFFAKN